MNKDKATGRYLKAFETVKKNTVSDPLWLLRLRKAAMTSFVQKGFPTAKDDAWRYTDVTAIRDTSFDVDLGQGKCAIPEFPGARIIFINGKYSREHSAIPEGVQVTDLRSAITTRPELLEKHLGRYADPKQNPFTALNTAFLGDGVLVHVPEGKAIEVPVRLIFYTSPQKDKVAFFLRNLILMEKDSKGQVAEIFLAGNEKKYLMSVVSEIVLAEGASLKYCKVQNEGMNAFHVASGQVFQSRGSVFSSLAISVGSKLMRQDSRVELADEHAECALNGVSLSGDDQLLDHHTFVDHQKPSGKSSQLFKGLLSGKSRGVFGGRVLVRQDAQQTDAIQTNKSLLLSDEAKMDTQPQLEILADDVKCSHGAAIGQLREDELFYLRSRGVGEKEAGRMLAQGFVQEVIERSNLDFMKETLLELVNEKLTQQLYSEKG